MPPLSSQVPDFASKSYWQHRFTAGESPAGFEWLGLPPVLTTFIQDWVGALSAVVDGDELDVLHIGSGSSKLSTELRRWLPPTARPSRIINVDYAEAAVSWGRQRESEAFGDERMRWATLDLLASADVVDVAGLASQQKSRPVLIIDKSTSDALSCGPELPSPFGEGQGGKPLHPLALLARNLALVAPSGSTWLIYTYSSADRLDAIDLGGLWTRARKELVDVPELDADGLVIIGRPCVQHAMEVWERTSIPAPVMP